MTVTATEVPGGWTEQIVPVGDRQIKLAIPADPDRFLDHLTSEHGAANDRPVWDDPYWAKLWPMAIELAQQVYAADWPANTRVIDLGCGCGMAGVAAAARGWDVTFSDYVPMAMDLAVENARRNGLDGKQLFLDWRKPEDHAFDVVLGSEILYDRSLHDPLLATLAKIVAPGGVVWLSDPGRTASEVFLPKSCAAGWKLNVRNSRGEEQLRLRFNQFNLVQLKRD